MRGAVAAAALALLVAVPSAADDAERSRRAAEHLLAMQLPNGLFRYDFDFLDGAPSGKDNVVRQAGALFALGEYLIETGDPRVAAALRAGLARLDALSLPLGKGELQSTLEALGLYATQSWNLQLALDRWGLLYRPEGEARVVAEPDGGYPTALSGGTALALLSELELRAATGDERFARARRAWLQGLLTLAVPGRGLRERPGALSESPYVNGEAWLALAAYCEAFPDDETAAAALRDLEEYLLDRYGEQPDRLFYHWGAMAAAARHRATGDPRFETFAARQSAWFLDQLASEEQDGGNTCATVEGLASALAVLGTAPEHAELAGRLREQVAAELAHDRTLQIREGQERLEVGGGAVLFAPRLADYGGAFLLGSFDPYTRIDLTQHCLSGLLKARRVGVTDGPGGDANAAPARKDGRAGGIRPAPSPAVG
jgi:hypothetical protein